MTTNTIDGTWRTVQRRCYWCEGTGRRNDGAPCPECNGLGHKVLGTFETRPGDVVLSETDGLSPESRIPKGMFADDDD